MKRLARCLSLVSLGLSTLTLVRPRSGGLGIALWYPKLIAGSWAPVLALAGTLGAIFGLARRDGLATRAGLLGALLAVRHVRRVIAPHGAFEEAFGPDWQTRIPPSLRSHLLPHRYTPRLPAWLRKPSSARAAVAPQVPSHRDLVYGFHAEAGDRLLADIWLPPQGVPRSGLGIIYLFGGAWHYMHKDLGTRHFVGRLAGQGHVVMNAGYTLAPQTHLLGQVSDVKRAIGWLKEHGSRYEVGPERIVLMGVSSGAHLALLAAYTPNHPKLQPADMAADTSVRAVVSYSGSPDLLSTYEYYRSSFGRYLVNDTLWERWFLAGMDWLFHRLGILPPQGANMAPSHLVPSFVGGTPGEVPELYHLGSPIEHVGPHCPPTLLMQGAHDYSGILPDVRRLHQALRRTGVTSVYVEYPETDHAFELVTLGAADWSPAARAAAYDTERFLALIA